MPTDSDRIRPTDYQIRTYLDELRARKYQIPTFQREVVWSKDSVKKLWDSIYRYYPIGSVLIWNTDLQLQNHREIGGHVIANDQDRDDYQYILDGQQRTTSLLTSLYGGRIAGRPDFDPSLYVDLTVEDADDVDDEVYKKRFLFWEEIDDDDGRNKRNIGRRKRYDQGLIVKLYEIMHNFDAVEGPLADGGYEYNHPVRERLRQLRRVIDNYRLSFIELRGIKVAEVCQIFERINQEGQPLDIFDIVVAKTFRPEQNGQAGFYFREMIDNFREETPGHFVEIDNQTYLQVIANLIRQHLEETGIYNVTPTYLNRIRTEQIEAVWDDTKAALRRLFDFLENHLHLKGPRLVPYRYFYLTLSSHFYCNPSPNYEFLKKYFWFYSFHSEDLLTNTTEMRQQADLLMEARNTDNPQIGERFLIDRHRLRTIAYSTRGRLPTAILALMANHEPRDWAHTDRHVLNDVYYELTDRPNLHHIFPRAYIERHPGRNRLNVDSMMNIAYLTQVTNRDLGYRNPLSYLQDLDIPELPRVLREHLVPEDILHWSRQQEMPDNALDVFIEKRIDLIIDDLRSKLSGISFDIVDTQGE